MEYKQLFLLLAIVSLFSAGAVASVPVFADDDDEEEDDDNGEQPKTLGSECAEELEDDDFDLEGLFCLAIFALQQSIADLQNQFAELFVQTDLDKPVLFLQVDPNSREPALVVNDGTNDVFTVNKDGSIQIGSSTVVLNPDGTVTGGPLILEAGSKVGVDVISTEPDDDTLGALLGTPQCDNKDLVQIKGGSWKCSKPADIVTAVGIIPGSSGITEFVIELVGPGMITAHFPDFEVLQDFKIIGLSLSAKEYTIPINLIRLEADMASDTGETFQIELEGFSTLKGKFVLELFLATQDPLDYRSKTHNESSLREKIIIEPGDTEQVFRLIGRTFGPVAVSTTGSFENLKLVMNLALPEGATIIKFTPP